MPEELQPRMTAISATQLSKSFGHYHVLQDITLEIPQGECFALFGPNGSGKTTLLKIFATLERPTSGHMAILGHDGSLDKEEIRASMMFLAHGSHLYEDLNAIENLQFTLSLRGLSPLDHDMKVALDRVAIGAFSQMKVRNFPAGMKKRLALAKAMLAQPQVLLLDEPFTALDTAGTEIMQNYIREVVDRQGTVLMSTHDSDKIRAIAHRAGIIQKGKIEPYALGTSTGYGLS